MFGQSSTWGQNNQNQQQQQQSGGLFGGGGGGFGQQPQQQNTGFGQNTGGFGQPAQQNTGGLFGGGNTNTSTSFGFGQNNNNTQNNAFGARPGFGAAGTSTFGQTANTGGLFGSSNASTSTFGQNNNTTTGGLFGKPATTTPTFGSGATSTLFGSKPATSPFGTSTNTTGPNSIVPYSAGPFPPPPATGSAAPPYYDSWQLDVPNTTTGKDGPPHLFHVISALEPYRGASFEELRALDYQQGRKTAAAQPPASAGFGSNTTGGFGQPAQTNTFGQPAAGTSAFGAKPGGLFGSTNTTTGATGFGQSSGGFGSNTNTGTGLFGSQPQPQQQNNLFGQSNTNTTGGLFGQQPQQPQQQQSGGLFGNTSNVFGQNNQQQQQQAGTSTFGGFGAPKPAFGASTGGFGQPAAGTSTFGQPAQAQPTNTFSFGQNQQQQQPQQQTGGLFGGGGFGTNNTQNTGTSLFGQNNQQQQQQLAAGGLFGSTAPKPAGGLFGATTAAAPSTGFTFGAQNTQQQPAASGGLFGSTNPSQPGGSSLFGQPQQQQQQPAASGGLFGNTNTAGSSLFGAKPATTAPAGGLFGSQPAQQPAQQGSSLFGGQSGGLFGGGNNTFGQPNQQQNNALTKPAGTGLFGGGSLFGAQPQQTQQPAAPGGLFGNLNQSQPASTGLFGSTTQQPAQGGLGGSMFGSTLGQSTMQQQQPTLTASLDQNPYGNNSLFTYTGQKLDYGISTKKPALPPLSASTFRLTPKKGPVNKLRGFASPLVSSQSPSRSSSPLNGLSTPGRSVGSPGAPDRYKGLTESALTPNAFVPRPSIKKLTVTPKSTNFSNSDDHLESVLGKSALRTTPNGRSTPARDAPSPRPQSVDTPTPAPTNPPAQQSTTPARPANTSNGSSIRPAADRQPKKGDYWCRPNLEKLKQLTDRDLSDLHNFVAGRKGYGEVTFLEPVDLTTIDISSFLGDVIVFTEMELAVYPDGYANKPARGEGLNVPAQVTLENCFPKDKASKQPITDMSDPRHARFLKRVKTIPDTEFVGYTEDGQWTFKVEHFSKYGLRDSDDESDGADETAAQRIKRQQAFSRSPSRTTESDDEDFMPPTKSRYDKENADEDHDSGMEEDDGSEDSETTGSDEKDNSVSASEDYEEESDTQIDWSQPIKASLGVEGMKKLREMQAGFFAKEKPVTVKDIPMKEAAILRAKRLLEQQDFDHAERGKTARTDVGPIRRVSFGQKASPAVLRSPRKYARVALKDSVASGEEGIRVDAGLALGRSFRCSWGPKGELVHFGKICAPNDAFVTSPNSEVFIQPVDLLAEDVENEKIKAERLLSLHLSRSVIEHIDGVPTAMIDSKIRFFDFTKLFDGGNRGHEAIIFRLGQALSDEIDLRLPSDSPEELVQRVSEVRRKLALSKWLEDAVSPVVDHDLVNTDNQPRKIFAYLSGNQIDRAVQTALDGNDMRLATLISQIGGPEYFRQEVEKQLDDWKKYKVDAHVSKDYRRLYALLAGITDLSPGEPLRGVDHADDVKISEGLDWKRAFGLKLWYGSPFEDTIGDLFASYTAALETTPAPATPLPPYLEKPTDGPNWNIPFQPTDILFEMIRLYSDPAISLDQVLRPRNTSPSPSDYRIIWHLYMLLSRVLSKRDFEDRDSHQGYSAIADTVTISYAFQLESIGQWVWAAFVLLHLETAEGRESAIKALLHRHPNISASEQTHLIDRLRIPETWLHEAKADSLASSGDVYGEYHSLLLADTCARAHRILVTKLAPEAVLRGDLALLRKLCNKLENKVDGWEYGGRLFLDYADLMDHSAATTPNPPELGRMAKSLPKLLQLLPSLFPKSDLHSVATLSDMLSGLHKLAGALHHAGLIPRPPVSAALVDVDRLHLLQASALDSFNKSLTAITSLA